MHESRHLSRSLIKLPVLLLVVMSLSQCKVYTIDKSHLENTLQPVSQKHCCKGKGLNNLLKLYEKQFNNHVDTLYCNDQVGKLVPKKLRFDSKLVIITSDNKAIKYYAQTLYIWKDEFLIGERIAPSLRSPNYFPVKLKDIKRIEVRG